MSYARNTGVSVDRSRIQLEQMLLRYGASEFGYVTREGTGALIGFVYRSVRIQMSIPLPDRNSPEFTKTPGRGQKRVESQAFAAWDAECRRTWRSLCLVVKALLVGIDDGVLTFEQAFMPYIVMGDGLTIYQHALPHIQNALETGHIASSLRQLEAKAP